MVRTLRGFRNRRVPRVVLLPFDEELHVDPRNQPHFVIERLYRATSPPQYQSAQRFHFRALPQSRRQTESNRPRRSGSISTCAAVLSCGLVSVEAVRVRPSGLGTILRFAPDLHPAEAPSHGTRDTDAEWAVLTAYCANAASLGDEETMPGMNAHCGTPSAYDGWVGAVEAHERDHEANYNGCAASQEFADTIAEVEGTLGDRVGEAVRNWNREFVAELASGMDHGVGPRTATVWNHHSGYWYTEAYVEGHAGSPCPS